jgi:membrane associated rhomboid family serine protease
VTLTNVLVVVNILAYIWEATTGGPDQDHGWLYGPAVASGQWWRIFTGAFLHGSIAHVGLNMLALYQVGNIVEQLYGRWRYAFIYLIAIVGSGTAVLAFNYTVPTLGASGAIFGLFGALVAVGLRLGKRGRGLIAQVLPIIGINLVFTYAVPGISAAAHVGGLITGFVVGLAIFMVPSHLRPQAYAYAMQPAAEPAVTTIEHEPLGVAEPIAEPAVREPGE